MNAFWITILGFAIILILSWIIKIILAPKYSFKDFLIGDTGGYSLSRLQAALWAFVIISYQVSALIAAYCAGGIAAADKFQIVFSEEVLWLLGLSLGSLIVVKGITVKQISTGEMSKKPTANPKLSDFITSAEGLDLSRFQMLIWTLIAITTFIFSCYNYYGHILGAGDVAEWFPKFADPDKRIPTVDMSFIVLMGLSNGAYIGRKLVPDFKKEEFTGELQADLKSRVDTIDIGLRFKEAEYEMMKESPTIPDFRKIEIEQELSRMKNQRDNLIAELSKSST